MSAVRKGESPQNTDVLVGAFIPKARVPGIIVILFKQHMDEIHYVKNVPVQNNIRMNPLLKRLVNEFSVNES